MKEAERRAQEEGILAPPGSEKIDMKAGEAEMEIPDNPKIMNFFLPILFLVAATVYFDVDMMKGVFSSVRPRKKKAEVVTIINENPMFKYWICFVSSGLISTLTPMFGIALKVLMTVSRSTICHLFRM